MLNSGKQYMIPNSFQIDGLRSCMNRETNIKGYAEKSGPYLWEAAFFVLCVSQMYYRTNTWETPVSHPANIWKGVAIGLLIAAFICLGLESKKRIYTFRFWMLSLLFIFGTLFFEAIFLGVLGLLFLLGRPLWGSFIFFNELFQKKKSLDRRIDGEFEK